MMKSLLQTSPNASTSAPNRRAALAGRLLPGLLAGMIPLAIPAAFADSPAEETAEQESVAWQTDFAKALETAQADEKNVLLRFTADWCPPCRVMDAQVWPEEEVLAAMDEGFVPVLVDIDERDKHPLVFRYGIRAVPTIVQVDSDGEEIARGGFMSASAMVGFLNGSEE